MCIVWEVRDSFGNRSGASNVHGEGGWGVLLGGNGTLNCSLFMFILMRVWTFKKAPNLHPLYPWPFNKNMWYFLSEEISTIKPKHLPLFAVGPEL
jgi:hypothetical protein